MRKTWVALLLLGACSSLKRVDSSNPPPPPSKPGVTWGKNAVGKIEVKTGFWCEVKGPGLLTFGASGPTEDKATEIAAKQCRSVSKDASCARVGCKPNK